LASRAFLFPLALALAGCASFDGRGLAPGQSSATDVERVMGAPADKRQVGGETWLYYPDQPFGRKVFVVRVGADARLIAVEQRLTEEYIAKLVPNQSRTEDVLALLGQPWERVKYPRLEREAWSWHMNQYAKLPAGLHVQLSPDGVVREVYILDERNNGERERP
jgi:hypothetical protein